MCLDMQPFPIAHVDAEDWRSACRAALEALGAIAAERTLGLVYASQQLAPDFERVIEYLKSHSPVTTWVGTVGSGICSSGRETYDQASLALLVTDLTAEQFRIVPGIKEDCAAFLAATALWRAATGSFFGVVHGDPRNPLTPELIVRLASGLENGYLVGGLTSSEGEFPQAAGSVTSGGISGVLLAGEVRIVTGLTQGCSLIGSKHRVTACQRNLVAGLDGRPALEVLKEDVGDLLARNPARMAGYIFAALPVPGSDTGDYLVRNLIGIDPESGVVAIGERAEEGMALQFARRDASTARADLERMLEAVKARLPGTPKGALYHSCLGRGRYLFGEHSEELRIVREHLGDLPLVGFYANGEISHQRLYGYTGVLTLFC